METIVDVSVSGSVESFRWAHADLQEHESTRCHATYISALAGSSVNQSTVRLRPEKNHLREPIELAVNIRHHLKTTNHHYTDWPDITSSISRVLVNTYLIIKKCVWYYWMSAKILYFTAVWNTWIWLVSRDILRSLFRDNNGWILEAHPSTLYHLDCQLIR